MALVPHFRVTSQWQFENQSCRTACGWLVVPRSPWKRSLSDRFGIFLFAFGFAY